VAWLSEWLVWRTAHHPLIPIDYQFTGQPVLVGGTMGYGIASDTPLSRPVLLLTHERLYEPTNQPTNQPINERLWRVSQAERVATC
jgi:hypothetical protein